MAKDEHEILRTELRRIIGNDYAYITAKDSQRHFDPITLATLYAGTMFVAFITKSPQPKSVEKAGKAIWEVGVSLLLTKAKPAEANSSEDQIEKIKAADDALDVLGSALSKDYFEQFLDAGRQSIEQRLIADNFPASKANRISSEFARVIAKRGKNENSA